MAMQKSLEQQLAETRARQERIKARLAQLEVRKKAKDERKRAQGTMGLVKAVLERIATQPAFKEEMRSLVAEASALKPHEREAALSVLASFDVPPSTGLGTNSANHANADPNHGQEARQAG